MTYEEQLDKMYDAFIDNNNHELTRNHSMYQYISNLVLQAHMAGSDSTKGTGLNLSKEQRAKQYMDEIGLAY